MGLLNMFSSASKIATGPDLLVLEELNKTSFKPVKFHDYYVKVMMDNPSRYLVISCSANGRIIPLIDCDSVQDHNEARTHFAKLSIRHAVFQSSPNHYWIFPDMTFDSFESAWKTICYVPGCDYKYLKFTKDRDFFLVRGELKESDSVPSLTHTSCVEPNVVIFIENIIKYFSDERLKVLASLKRKRLVEWNEKKEKEQKRKATEQWSAY